LAAARAEIAMLQRMFGKKTLENAMLREAVEYATGEHELRARPCCQGTKHEGCVRQPGCGALECS